MLHTTNLVLLVGKNEMGDFSPRKATIYKTNDSNVICSFWPFTSNITLAKINKKRIILQESSFIHIYSTEDMTALHKIDIGNNITPNHIVLSSSSEKNNFLVYTTSENEGIIKVYDLLYLSYKGTFQAHKTQIEQMNINSNGDMLVTCSIKGTMIRVFSLPKGEKIHTIKRGISNAQVFSIAFDIEKNDKIVLSGNTGTIHIIDLKENLPFTSVNNGKNEPNGESGLFGFVNKIKSQIISKDYEEMMNYQRPCISANFQEIKDRNIIGFKGGSGGLKVFAINERGEYYLFDVNYKSNTINKIYENDLTKLKLIDNE